MPLYYFDVFDGTREPDLAGSECGALEQARVQAVKFVGELLRHNAESIWDGHDLRVEVSDEDRTPLFAIVTSAMSLYPAP